MAFIYYTDARVIELYDGYPPGSEQAQKAPPKVYSLRPQTKVTSETDYDKWNILAQPYVQVTVAEGRNKPTGWVLRKFIRKCLKIDTPNPTTNQRFTGVTYGDSKASLEPEAKKDVRYVPKGLNCQVCGLPGSDHRIYESQSLRDGVQKIIRFHLDAKRGGGIMFGMLEARFSNGYSVVLAAESGFAEKFAPTVASVRGMSVPLHYVSIKHLSGKKYRNFLFENPRKEGGFPKSIGIDDDEMRCAAPKLLQCLLHYFEDDVRNGAPMIYLSEVWCRERDSDFQPGVAAVDGKSLSRFQHLETAASCDLCRKNLPAMLCGHKNLNKSGHRTRLA